MSSDSSAEEDNIDLLREAVDNEFTTNLFTSNDDEKDKLKEKSVQKKSLRPVQDTEGNESCISPEVQKFIAKHLFGRLESLIKEVEGPSDFNKRELVGGVHLLSSSKNFVSSKEEEPDVKTLNRRPKRYYPKKLVADVTEEERCREAAVSAEWILSQEAISGWEVNTKGRVEVYSAGEVEVKTVKKKCENKVPVQTDEERKEKKRLKKKRFREKMKLLKSNEKVAKTNDSRD